MNVAPHLFWITSRAAGGAALLPASASVALGLMMSSKRQSSNKRDLRAIHEALSLTTLAMVALHGLALLGDSFLAPGPDRHRDPLRRRLPAALDRARDRRRLRPRRARPLLLLPRPHRRRALAPAPPAHRGLLAARDRPHDRGRQRRRPALVPVVAAWSSPAALLLVLRWLGRAGHGDGAEAQSASRSRPHRGLLPEEGVRPG